MKIAINQNRWGNWYGYVGGRRVEAFGNDSQGTAEQHAQQWLREKNLAEVEAIHGDALTRLWLGHSRTTLEIDTTDVNVAAALVVAAENRQLPVLATLVTKGRAKRVPHLRVTMRAREYDIAVRGNDRDDILRFDGISAEGVDWVSNNAPGGIGFSTFGAGRLVERAIEAGLRVRTR